MTTYSSCTQCDALRDQVRALQRENQALRQQLARQQQRQETNTSDVSTFTTPHSSNSLNDKSALTASDSDTTCTNTTVETYSPLTRIELERYSRQMLVSDFGVARQLALKRARVLVVGVGGLGSPIALYLAAMGIGRLGLVDDDRVERSNLHRQVIHDESTVGLRKVDSAAQRIAQLNPLVQCDAIATRLTAANALALAAQYDVVVDASDNVATRYLVNDACVRLRKPLVSGSALGLEGQVTVFAFNDGAAASSACYRCLYPTPQPAAAAMSCADNGVVGVVPGIIGCLQAIETIKVLTRLGTPLVGVQCFYDAFDSQFRRLTLQRERRVDCIACSDPATNAPLSFETLACALSTAAPVLSPQHRMSAERFHALRHATTSTATTRSYVLLDTRTQTQFDIVHFPEAHHVPFELLQLWQQQQSLMTRVQALVQQLDATNPQVLVICRRGVDSVTVTHWLVASGFNDVVNIDGGYEAYATDADKSFPMY